jgi:exodeoxyribonuclease-3
MKVTTWNVNGVRARAEAVLEWVSREQPDVLCLQEIKASPEAVPASVCALDGYWCHWHGHKGYSGVALHLRRSTFPAPPAFVHPPFDVETRIVTAVLGPWVIASVYVPNGNRNYPIKVRFLEALDAFVADVHASGRQVLLCGDLNVALEARDVHPKLRKPTETGQTPAEQAMLAGILGHGLVDLLRRFDPENDRLFTWWAPWRQMRERNIGWRLDYVLASASLAESARSCTVSREFGTSDHAPVTAVLDLAAPAYAADEPEPPARPRPKGQLVLDLRGGGGLSAARPPA